MYLITTYLYQPFLNLLVFFYWLIGHTPLGYDMGVAVILLTLAIRFLLLPITLSSQRSEAERRKIHESVKEVEAHPTATQVEKKEEIRKILRGSPRILISEVVMFVIQLAIALILWRIFATGLTGEDLHLLYSFMPEVPEPYVLSFLGKYDLTHPDLILNIVQTLVIFLLETLVVLTSPYHVSRSEVVRVQFVLPVISFAIFAFLPAGKKLFMITTLLFSISVLLLQIAYRTYKKYFPDPEPEPEKPAYPYPYPYPPYYPPPPPPAE
jgi:YidC/Oxa1 family membrane protein insertase